MRCHITGADVAAHALLLRMGKPVVRDGTDDAAPRRLRPPERLRRLELYGHDKHHPADEPHRHAASVLVFHLADVDTIDAS